MQKQTQDEQHPVEKRQCLPHADDVVVLGIAVKPTVETVKCVTIVASQVGLTINASKNAYVINRKKTDNASQEFEVYIRKCRNFQTSGPLVTITNETDAEIKARIIDSNK